MLINFFWKTALFDWIKPATSLLLFVDNDFEKILTSARKKEETLKLMVHTIARTNKMNAYIFEVQVIDERVDSKDHFTASLFQERWLRILT